MAKNRNLIIGIAAVIVIVLLFRLGGEFKGAVFSFDDPALIEIPLGMGAGVIPTQVGLQFLDETSILFQADYQCDDIYGACGIAGGGSGTFCCLSSEAEGANPDPITHFILGVPSSPGAETTILSLVDKLHISLKEEQDFFEDDFVIFTIVTNPDSDFVPNPSPGVGRLPDGVAFAWFESELILQQSRDEAIRRFGKPVEWTDLSKKVVLNNIPQEFIFDLGQLPVGEYKLYVVFAEANGQAACRAGIPSCSFRSLFDGLSQILVVNFLVNPKPLTLFTFDGASCVAGYNLNNPAEDPNSDGICDALEGARGCTCVRDDVTNLACSRLGCPIDIDFSYSCGSDGFCSEVVFFDKRCTIDLDCGEGFSCNPSSGRCYNTEIIKEFLQCTPGDLTVCQNLNCKDLNGNNVAAIGCDVNNLCIYSGQCDVQLDNCNNLGCPSDFICIEETGVCQRTIIEQTTTIITETKVQEIVGESLLQFPKIPKEFLIGGIVLIIVLLFLKRNKRR